MCGIWGYFPNDGKLDTVDMGVVEQMMTITSLRGKDSTGVAVISDPRTRPRVLKMVDGPDYLLNSDAWGKVAEFALKKGSALFGHGRYGTKGAAIAKNAHPHVVEHITLVHNGTINYGLEDQHKAAQTENDSLALTHAIATDGLVPALVNIYGAYALIIHDSKQEKVFFVRNDERPLHMIRWNQATLVMSEQEALQYLVTRSSTLKPEVAYFKKHVIYSIDLKTGAFNSDNSLVEAHAKKYIAPPPPPVTTYNPAGWKSGGATGSAVKNTHIERFFSEGYNLLLDKCEKMSKGADYRLIFTDDSGEDVTSFTRHDQKDRIGTIAIAYKLNVTRTSSGEEFKYATYKDLKWQDESPKVEKGEEQAEPARFRNNVAVNRTEAKRILNKHDCALCQGVVRESEIPETILMSDDKLICPDCIRQGKHYSFGFGQ